MVRTDQGGSILNFLIIGGAMALLLIGGAYIVRRNFTQAENRPQIAVTDDQKDTSKEDANKEKTQAEDKNTQQKETEKTETSTFPGGTDNSSTSSGEDAKIPQPATGTSQQPATGLPETGPSSVFFAGLMLSSLVAASIAYVQSFRPTASL